MPCPRAAILYDVENRWALTDAQGFVFDGGDKDYLATCVEYYRFFWERGIAVDVVSAHADLSGYSLVVAPQLYMTDSDTVPRLTEFVKGGGTLYATYMLGMVDGTDLCHLGGFPGGGLRRVFGIWNEEIDTLYPEERSAVVMNGKPYTGKTYCEILHAEGAEVLATYAADFYKGTPALTVNAFGKGKAYYQAFRDEGDFKDEALERIIAALGIEKALPVLPQKGVSAHTRTDGTHTYLFVENYSGERVTALALGDTYLDMESGEPITHVSLNEYDVRVLKK